MNRSHDCSALPVILSKKGYEGELVRLQQELLERVDAVEGREELICLFEPGERS